jgi:predicted NAD/FAD-binding protein
LHKPRIAVIGSGISGLSSAWLQRNTASVTLFESNPTRFGGHSNTVCVDAPGGDPVPVDTGFIVFNDRNYPNLVELFEHVGIEWFDTTMSFALSEDGGQYEYSGSGASGLFAQRGNFFAPRHWRMLLDIVAFNKAAKQLLVTGSEQTIGEFLRDHGFGRDLIGRYLLPMAAAIWSCPTSAMDGFPALSLCRFYENHGLLDLRNRPQWRSVVGGSRVYVARLLDDIGRENCHHDAVTAVRASSDSVDVQTRNGTQTFDQVIFACHADEALQLIANPQASHSDILGAFEYQTNIAWLHSDTRLMPARQRVWSAWNYLASSGDDGPDVTVSYWMNLLQNLPGDTPYIVTLNPIDEPEHEKVIERIEYQHPIFSQAAIDAQSKMDQIQGIDRMWFCGSYCGNGFHEDGIKSAVGVATRMGVKVPWQSADADA